MNITPSDIDWLSINYPSLRVCIGSESVIIEGHLYFSAKYNKSDGTYTINPTTKDNLVINDNYKIQIYTELNPSHFPIIRETLKRISGFAKLKNIAPQNLHVNPGVQGFMEDSLCVVGPIDMEIIKQTGISLRDLIERILIPFFYDNSYYEKHNIRLRSDFSHDIWGLIENYFEYSRNIDDEIKNLVKGKIEKSKQWVILKEYFLNNKIIKGHSNCIVCGNSKIRDCHFCLFRGIRKIQNDKIFKG